MDDTFGVQVLQSTSYLPNDVGYSVLLQSFLQLDLLVDLATRRILQNDVECLLIVEATE